jgi:heat shock protein HslJ
MKKQVILVLLVIALIMSCKTTVTGSAFSNVVGKEWKLIEVQVDSTPFNRIVLYDRNDLRRNNVGSVYTMNFDAEMVSGTGAPNKYSAPYTLGEENSLKVEVIRSTMMAPIIQPEKLPEHDFYTYMTNVEQWSIDDGKLVLHTKAENGNTVRLIFVL